MNINQETLQLIMDFEGWRSKAYTDAVGVWTIGYGHTSMAGEPKVTPGLVITKQQGEEILRRDVEKFATGVAKLISRPLNDNQFGALVSLAFNIGLGAFGKSTALRLVNAGRFSEVPAAMAMFRKAGGKVLEGLVRRRKAEGALFLKPAKGQGVALPLGGGGVVAPPASASAAPGDRGAQVEMLQLALQDLGYHVGKIDGVFGSITGAALLGFQQDNGLATTGIADPATLAALAVARNRPLSGERSGATAEELRAQGSEIVKRSDQTWWAGLAAAVLGGSGFLQEKLPGVFKNIGDGIEGLGSQVPASGVPGAPEFFVPLVKTAASLLGVSAGGPWGLVAGLGGYVVYNAIKIRRKRVDDHRSGAHIGR